MNCEFVHIVISAASTGIRCACGDCRGYRGTGERGVLVNEKAQRILRRAYRARALLYIGIPIIVRSDRLEDWKSPGWLIGPISQSVQYCKITVGRPVGGAETHKEEEPLAARIHVDFYK